MKHLISFLLLLCFVAGNAQTNELLLFVRVGADLTDSVASGNKAGTVGKFLYPMVIALTRQP